MLPAELAATLAQAITVPDQRRAAADAGVPAVPDADEVPPSSVAAAENQHRADALFAVLASQRQPTAAETTNAKPDVPARPLERAKTPPRGVGARAAKTISPKQVPEASSVASAPASAIRRITKYACADQVFAVATAPMRVTDIMLERGETLVSQPIPGDAARWVISVSQGADRSHVFVKPLRPDLRTNLTLATNRRTYFLELTSHDDGTYMAGVQWAHPGEDAERRREALARAERERQSITAISDLQALRFDYAIRATEGATAWKPTMVFHDGGKTFIRFSRAVDPKRAPILLIPRTGSARDAAYVNYRVKGDLYVVERVLDEAELRLPGEDGQDIVRITRKL